MPTISLKGVSKSFSTIQALKSVSFDIPNQQIVGFVGANGAGKTTAMRIIMGVLQADSGQVLYDNKTITSEQRKQIGYMPSERGLYPKMKVSEQLIYLARLHGLTKTDAKLEVDKWLAELNVQMYANSVLKTLSTGNAQRVQLASALVIRPTFLILDEPFSGLDPIAVANMSDVIRSMADGGISVLFSSHQLELVDELCDRVLIIKDGAIVQNGSPSDLRQAAGAAQTIEVPTPLSHIFADLLQGGDTNE